MEEKGIIKLFNMLKKVLSSIAISFSCIIILILLSNTILTQLNANNEEYQPFISLYTIVSPSMTPVIDVYDVVVNTKVRRAENVEVGDIITYKSKSSMSEGMTITHRVITINKASNGKITFVTQGDNNDAPDAQEVEFEDIVGKKIFIIPGLGKLQFLLATKKGWIFLLLIPISIIIIKDLFKLIDLFGLSSRVDKLIKEEVDEYKKKYEEERKEELKEKLHIEDGVIKPTNNVEYNQVLHAKIDEYNKKIAELDQMIYDLEHGKKPKVKHEIKEEDYLKGKKIKVVSETPAKKKRQSQNVELPKINLKKHIIGIEKVKKD